MRIQTCAQSLLVVLMAAWPLAGLAGEGAIRFDQVGYLPTETKLAMLTGEAAGAVSVKDAGGREVLRVKPGASHLDPDSGDKIWVVDFSGVTLEGTYTLEAPGLGASTPFRIDSHVYDRAWYLATRFFYGQRCGIAVDLGPEFPGYRHDACHTQDGCFHASSGREGYRAAQKGWHDAGDYGKYVVNSGITTGELLWAYEWFPGRLNSAALNIPESGNGTPDLLNEARWNLEWMLTMQDSDGGVWPKLTTARFCGFILPELDTDTRFIIGSGAAPFKTTCATADFAAVMAAAARCYAPFDAKFSQRCLGAAQSAWQWALANPASYFRDNPAGIGTGGYGDDDSRDELLWAAAEMFRTTGDAACNRYFLDHYTAFKPSVSADSMQDWRNVRHMGMWAYLFSGQAAADPEALKNIRADTLAAADALVQRDRESPGYRNSLVKWQYFWGSNGVVANNAVCALVARRIQDKPAYLQVALDNLHYFFGRNTFGVSFVTRMGSNPVRHPHHRPSMGDNLEEPWPGMLAGGPNAQGGSHDGHTPADPYPARCWADQDHGYASNEVAINWNAPLVFVLSALLPEKAPAKE